jgi:2-C-methyl-D-erythritol 4-phosphate cytidylyltransferase/2-C-methyl-D-erythritol 2,4-cyclodiphosphate synthase
MPKQYCIAGGRMILRHTIEKFLSLPGLRSIRVIIDPAHRAYYDQAVSGLTLPPPVSGASTRKRSVYNGLKALEDTAADDIVLIHDAARPFVTQSQIETLLQSLGKGAAATLAAKIADTLVTPDYARLDRDRISAVQTPQAFRLSALRAAHEKFLEFAGRVG